MKLMKNDLHLAGGGDILSSGVQEHQRPSKTDFVTKLIQQRYHRKTTELSTNNKTITKNYLILKRS